MNAKSALLRATTGLSAIGMALALSACGTADTAPVAHKAAAEEANSRAAVTYLIECVPDNVVQEPETFVLTCADANESLSNLSWKNWGEDTATATGTLSTNNCDPTCVDGSVEERQVTVRADKIVNGEAAASYTRLTIDGETYELPGVDPVDSAAE